MNTALKIVIPMAGYGTRLRPHTWSRPKQLVTIAGKSVLSHVLDMLSTLPNPDDIELIFIVGYLGDKVETYMKKYHPEFNVKYVLQEEMRGQSHAIYLAREYLNGPMLMVFADTLIETDLSFLKEETADAVAWVKPVPDPRRFGVAEVGTDGWVTRLIEKPKDVHNNLAVVGFYYFREAEELIDAIEEQMRRSLKLKGEYFLADAINVMLDRGLKMRTNRVDVWLDAGTLSTVLETNRYFLDHGQGNTEEASQLPGVMVVPPVFVHPTADVKASVLGPYASIGPNCKIRNSVIRESIIENGAQVSDVVLAKSLIGQNAQLNGCPNNVNIGDNSAISLGECTTDN
jgi:glucose-1-phosphate thymidylyltransferase